MTSLTVTASRRFGFSAEKVLELAQSLYDKKAITYPRTDCAYLPADMIPKLPAHLKALRQEPYQENVDEAMTYSVPQNKRVINTITAHHAIIPTTETVHLNKLPEAERQLFDLIARRFLAVWFPPAWYQQTEIVTEAAQEHFRSKGRILLSSGWKMVYDFEDAQDTQAESSGTTGKTRRKIRIARTSKKKTQNFQRSVRVTLFRRPKSGSTKRVPNPRNVLPRETCLKRWRVRANKLKTMFCASS